METVLDNVCVKKGIMMMVKIKIANHVQIFGKFKLNNKFLKQILFK